MLLQQRRASGSQASCSYAARPVSCSTRRPPVAAARHRVKHVCRMAEVDEAELELEVDDRNDTIFDRMVDENNILPDYDDPAWVEKVTDWEEFWYEDEDILGVGDEDMSPAEAAQQSLLRAQQLVSQLSDLRKRGDVEQMIGARVRPPQTYDQEYTSEAQYAEEMDMHRLDPNPDWNLVDVRAVAEKRRQKAILDAEWERQGTLLARPFSFTLQKLETDARLQGYEYEWIREQWTHEQIMDMIVGGGKFVHPEKVPATVMNPLMPADFHAAGVRAVPDTEEFIASIGHMATEDEILHIQSEVTLEESDFVDPTAVFEDQEHNVLMEAPVNNWAQLRKARDSSEIELFEKLVDRMTARQERREALAAAKAAAEAGEDISYLDLEGLGPEGQAADADGEEEEDLGMDELMGEGFTEFMKDEGVVFYDVVDDEGVYEEAEEEEGEYAEGEYEDGELEGEGQQ